jgi:hypothetical protein
MAKGLALIIGAGGPSGPRPAAPDLPEGKDPDGTAQTSSTVTTTDTIPLNALAMPDDQEQMQAPQVGDEVNYQVTGKVVSIDGNTATVQKTSINGEPVGSDDEERSEPQGDTDDEDAEAAGLRNQAAVMGNLG